MPVSKQYRLLSYAASLLVCTGTAFVSASASAQQEAQASPQQADSDAGLVARALERSLVREGGILLPRWNAEIEAQLAYSFRGTDALEIIEVEGETLVVHQRAQHDLVRSSLGLRVGLPNDGQAEVRIPYIFVREEFAAAGAAHPPGRASGMGAITFALSKHLLYERRAGFDILGAIVWRSRTEQRDLSDEVALGSGFESIQANLTAVERRDPLIFFGTVSYTTFLSRSEGGIDIKPGAAVGGQAGTVLAAGPEASLRAAFKVSRFLAARAGDQALPGSGSTVGSFEIGASAIVGARALIWAGVEVGVTHDAPDFGITMSFSYRID